MRQPDMQRVMSIWSDFDTWYRQTDIVYDPYRLQTAKVTLHKERPVIDIGRVFPMSIKDNKSC
jgi:hypothetical protein